MEINHDTKCECGVDDYGHMYDLIECGRCGKELGWVNMDYDDHQYLGPVLCFECVGKERKDG